MIETCHHRVFVFWSHQCSEFLHSLSSTTETVVCSARLHSFLFINLEAPKPSIFFFNFFVAGSTFTAKRMQVLLKSRSASTRAPKAARLLAGRSWTSWTRKLKIPRRRFFSPHKNKILYEGLGFLGLIRLCYIYFIFFREIFSINKKNLIKVRTFLHSKYCRLQNPSSVDLLSDPGQIKINRNKNHQSSSPTIITKVPGVRWCVRIHDNEKIGHGRCVFLFAAPMRFPWRFWHTTTLLDAWLEKRDATWRK